MSTVTALSEKPSSRFDLKAAKQVGAKKLPPRLVIVGEGGIGKTTFASNAPDPILIATEDGADAVDVPKLPLDSKCETWGDLVSALRALMENEHDFKTLILDTLNAAEELCASMVTDRDFGGVRVTKKGKEGFDAYGKGDKAVAYEMRQLLGMLDYLRRRKGMMIILIAHEGLHKQANALGADFQKFGGRLSKSAWPLVFEWADQVAHACRDFSVEGSSENKAGKAVMFSNERWLSFEGGPAGDFKARAGYEMPERILLDWDAYASELQKDHLGALVEQALDLLGKAPEGARAKISERIGGKATAKTLRELGKDKLVQLINWLNAKVKQQEV